MTAIPTLLRETGKRPSTWPVAAAALAFLIAAGQARAQDHAGFKAALDADMAAAGVESPPDLDKVVSEGVTELQSGNWILAAQRFGEIYRQSRDHPLPPLLIGVACVGMKQYEKASEFVRYAMLKWPGLPAASPPLKSWLGGADGHAKLLKEIEDDLFSRKPGSPEGSTALFLAGFFHLYGGTASRGVKYMMAVPEGAKEFAAARLVAKTGRALLDRPAAKRPNRAEQAARLFAEGRYADAAHAFGTAVVEDPADPLSWFEMGHALFACGYFRHAARVIAVGLDMEPAWAGLDVDLEELYPDQRKPDFRSQLAALETWTASHADDHAARFLLGYVLHFSNRRSQAGLHFAAAAAGGWSRQAALFASVGQGNPEQPGPADDPANDRRIPADDEPDARKPPEESPAPPPVEEPAKPPARDIVAEGAARLSSGDAEGAAKLFTLAFSDPGMQARAMTGFACVNAARGDVAEGARWVRAAFKSSPDTAFSGEFSRAFKTSSLLSRKLDEMVGRCAAIDSERAGGRKLAQDDRDAWLLCGFCLMQAGRLAEARARFNEILLEFEDSEKAAIDGFARASAALLKKG